MSTLTAFIENTITIDGELLTVERSARWLVMSAYLYYERSCNKISDGDYDKLSNFVADNWDELSDQMKWQLNSPSDIRATGNGIKITQMGESAAITWYGKDMEGNPINYKDWRGPDKKHKCMYYVISG